MIGFLKNAWRGQAKLWKVFWLLGFLFIIPTIIVMIVLPMMFMSSPVVMILLMFLWFVLISGYHFICVWKCAFNCGWKGWGYIARIIVALSALSYVAQLVMVGMAAMMMGKMASAFEHMESDMDQPSMVQFGDPSSAGALPSNLEEAMKELEMLNQQMEEGMGDVNAVMQEAERKMNEIEASESAGESLSGSPVDTSLSGADEGVASVSRDVLVGQCEGHFNAEYEARGLDPEGATQERQAYVDSCVPSLLKQIAEQGAPQ